MSHVVTAKGTIRDDPVDMEALKNACTELGLVFCPNQTTFQWFGAWAGDYHGDDAAYRQGIAVEDYGKCVHAIRLAYTAEQEKEYAEKPDTRPYEIGLIRDKETGHFKLIYDFWQGGKGVAQLQAAVGTDCNDLLAAVSKHKVIAATAREKGYYVKSVTKVGAKTKLVLGVRQAARS